MKLNLNFSDVKVDKRSELSRKELYNEYIKPEIPVVLKDAAKDWNAMGKITPEFFKKNYPITLYMHNSLNRISPNENIYAHSVINKIKNQADPSNYAYALRSSISSKFRALD